MSESFDGERPAWSQDSSFLRLPTAPRIEDFSPEWAFGSSTGEGVRVAIIDSGIDADHPNLEDAVDIECSVEFNVEADGTVIERDGPHADVYGHGTACAGIVHALAPDAKITSVRVLDAGLRGRAAAFYAGLNWAIERGFEIINLSLGAAKRDWALAFHDLCDRGYFTNSFIVTAANNVQRDSFPSLFASVTSVATNNSLDPLRFHYNPTPPTEFLARGINVEVPWLHGTTITTTGNSFAAPHIAAFAALIKAEHPELRPFQVKSALWAAAANVREAGAGVSRVNRPVQRSRTGRSTMMRLAVRSVPATGPTSRAEHDLSRTVPPTPPTEQLTEHEERAILRVTLDGYQIGHLVARGPWGPVYAGTKDGTDVALRLLDPVLASDSATRRRFLASVRIATALDHPNIVPITELREVGRFAVMAMPLCPSNLRIERERGALDAAAGTRAVIEALRGLQAAHARGIYHGDLRPENILLTADRRAMVGDVGIVSALGAIVQAGTIRYLAPEQLARTAIGGFTDVFAAGAVLYEILAEGLPERMPDGGFPPLQAEQRGADQRRAVAVNRATAVDPARRHLSAASFADELTAALTD